MAGLNTGEETEFQDIAERAQTTNVEDISRQLQAFYEAAAAGAQQQQGAGAGLPHAPRARHETSAQGGAPLAATAYRCTSCNAGHGTLIDLCSHIIDVKHGTGSARELQDQSRAGRYGCPDCGWGFQTTADLCEHSQQVVHGVVCAPGAPTAPATPGRSRTLAPRSPSRRQGGSWSQYRYARQSIKERDELNICGLCGYDTPNLNVAFHHMVEDHSARHPKKCLVCEYWFLSPFDAGMHHNAKHTKTGKGCNVYKDPQGNLICFVCATCKREFPDGNSVIDHGIETRHLI